MYIEVTKDTFYNIFNDSQCHEIIKNETSEESNYYNKYFDQYGKVITCFLILKSKFYLRDINA